MTLRRLTGTETRIIDKLLTEDFPGRGAIREQIRDSLVREIDSNGSLEFQVQAGPIARTDFRIPVEGEFEDIDGVTIHVLLHVVNGRLNELEVYKDDSARVAKMPGPENLRIFIPK
jgi:hypothetical protein